MEPPLSSHSDSPNFDVLVVGGGAAGLYCALCLPAHYRVGLITKETLSRSASDWAQGGIAAALAPEDSVALHIEDTLKAGAGLCEPAAVVKLAESASTCIEHLLALGVAFDQEDGHLAMTLEAAHSRRRVLHAADTTGRAIVSILAQRVLERPNIQVLEQAFGIDLWLAADGSCRGVLLAHQQQIGWYSAQAVVLATGGGGQVYSHTTNPPASTGDGVAMAWRAGAIVRDLEFFQFHPTALSHPGAPPFLISEAVRGEGARLVDQQGKPFTHRYHPDGDLAPRDVVSRAIFQHLQATGEDQVLLDMRSIAPQQLEYRFPNILQVCRQWGLEPLEQPIPVSPAAHYWMGGIQTDTDSHTTVSNLYAVGENASTGVHGANRLASNSLLECLVFGAQLRQISLPAKASATSDPGTGATPAPDLASALSDPQLEPTWAALRQTLADLVWQNAGICRDQTHLESAIAQLAEMRHQWERQPINQIIQNLAPPQAIQLPSPASVTQLKTWGELRNLLDIAWLILKSADFRQESRGGHFRSDFPQTEAAWRVHTVVQGEQWLRSHPIADP